MCYFFCIFGKITFCINKNMLLINHAVCTFQPYHHAPHAFVFSGLLLCGWRLCYVLLPPNTKFTGKTNHSYTTTKQLEKRFWLCQKFRGQLFVPAEPVVRRKGEKSINALAPLPKLYIPSTINIWRKLLTILAE